MQGNNFNQKDEAIKVSIITQFYPPDYAATGQLIEELALHLGSQNLQVHIFTGQPGYAFQKASAPAVEQMNHVMVRRSRTSQFWSKRIRGKALNGITFCVRAGLHLLRVGRKCDVLLLTTAPPYLSILGYLSHLLFGVPYVCLLYDVYPDIAIQLNVISEQHYLAKIWRYLNHKIWGSAQHLIVLSPTMKEQIAALYPEVADKISVIHSWAEPDWIVPLEKQDNWFAKQHDFVESFTVLYSGNMGRCHDLETILETAQLLQNAAVKFVFIGDGAKRSHCIDTVEKLGLTNCCFLPYQDKQLLPYSLTACDLALVSVSQNMEGLVAPSKIYSALAAARPIAVICAPHCYLHQMIIDAGCGETFRHQDSRGLAEFILHLSTHSTLAQAMGNAGRHYLQTHFTPNLIAQQYAQILRQSVRSPQSWSAAVHQAERQPRRWTGQEERTKTKRIKNIRRES